VHPFIHKGLLLVLLIQLSWNANAQQELPIREWITMLCAKEDDGSIKFREIVLQCLEMDSSSYCAALRQLTEDGPLSNTRFQVRLKLLEGRMYLYGKPCWPYKANAEMLEEALLMAYQIEDRSLMFEVHQALAAEYTTDNHLGLATLHALSAAELAEQPGREKLNMGQGGWYNLGYLLFHSRQYQPALVATTRALNPPVEKVAMQGDTLALDYKMNAWNTVGLCYEYLNKPDSAFIAFDHAYVLAEKLDQPFWKGVIKGNKGDVYFKMGAYDSAAVLLNYDYQQSMATAQYDNAANSLQWLSRIQLYQSDPQTALKSVREARRLLDLMSQPTYMANMLYTFTQVFKALGNADSVSYYMDRYLVLHDSIEKTAYDSRAEIVKMRMDNQSNVHTITTLSREKRNIAVLRNFIIAFILLVFTIGLLIINRQKLKLKLRQQEALEGQRRAEEKAAQAIDQLNSFTQNLVEKSSLIENLQSQLIKKEMNEDQVSRISELTQHAILTEEDWERFKMLFENVYPGFFFQLRSKNPDITLAEQRIAALIKLKLSVKESAALLGISPNSVYKTRQRLNNRLGFEFDAELDERLTAAEVS